MGILNDHLPETREDPWHPHKVEMIYVQAAVDMAEAISKRILDRALHANLELTVKLTNAEISRGILTAMLEQLVREVHIVGATEFVRGDLMERCSAALLRHGQ